MTKYLERLCRWM